jgi:hypothetical protein
LRYWDITSILPLEDATIVALNVGLLFFVSIEPYLFYLNITFDLVSHELLLDSASIIYALDMTGLMLILTLFTQQLAREEAGLVSKKAMGRYKQVRNLLLASAILFLISTLPPFWTIRVGGQAIRFYFWFIPLVISSIRLLPEHSPQEQPQSQPNSPTG